MTTVNALKEFTAVIVGGVTAAEIPGTTIPEVIMYLAKNYPSAETMGELTVVSTPGGEIETTKITVTPTITSGNRYVYLTEPTEIDAPEYLADADTWTSWDGTSDIHAEDGHYIGICEVNANDQIVKFGQTIVTVNLG